MTLFRRMAALLVVLPCAAQAQTADGSPTAPASPGVLGTPRPVSRTAPGAGLKPMNPAPGLPADRLRQVTPKMTAAERAEQRKLEQDLKICIGC